MTAAAYVRLYQEGHARNTGYQVTEWVDGTTTSWSLRAPFIMSRLPSETPDAFERIATPIDILTYTSTNLRHFEIRGGAIEPYADVTTNLALSGVTQLVIDTTSIPHWDVTTVINTISYASVSNEQIFDIASLDTVTGGTGVRVVDTNLVYLTDIVLNADDIGTWLYLSGMTTGGNNGAMRVDGFEGELVRVFRSLGALTVEDCPSATWSRKYILLHVNRPFLCKEPRLPWSIIRDDGGSPIAVSNGTIGIISTYSKADDFYRTDRMTLLFSTLDQALSHMASVKSYLQALQEAQNTIDENVTFGTLGPFDYPSV